MRYRYRVLVLLVVPAVIVYLDRVLIAVAGPRMQQERVPRASNHPVDGIDSADVLKVLSSI